MKALPQLVKAFVVGLLEMGFIIIVGQWSGTDVGTMWGGLVLMSIICTAGLSLLIWIPVLTGMGMVTILLLGLIFPAMRAMPGDGPRSATSGAPSSGSGRAGISRYIERMQGAGMPDEVILERLKRAGWSEKEIGSASGRS